MVTYHICCFLGSVVNRIVVVVVVGDDRYCNILKMGDSDIGSNKNRI